MKKKILIPTDFSKNAMNAFTYATEIFKNQECTFYLVNAYAASGYNLGDMMVPEPGTKSYENASTISQTGLEKIIATTTLKATNPKHRFETISEFGDPLRVVRSVVEKKDIHLVVMGTKGISNNKGVLFGSNTITTMEKVRNCPVLGIPQEATTSQIKEIVFPTSYKTHYKRRELSYLVDLATQQNANICILYVNPDEKLSTSQEENKVLLAECLEGASFSFHHLSGINPTEGVRNFVESRESDMVAIINKKHAFFGSVFTSPMVKELGLFSKVPLLVMHDLRN